MLESRIEVLYSKCIDSRVVIPGGGRWSRGENMMNKSAASLSSVVSEIHYGCYASGSGHWHGHATFR